MTDLPILIVLLLVVALLFRVDFIFYIVYVTLGITIWSHWYTPRALRQLHFKRDFNSHAFLGEKISVKIFVDNTSFIPVPWLQLDESIATELRGGREMKQAFTLAGRSSKSFSYDIRAMRRGYYQLGPGQIAVGDLFGFKENKSRLPPNYLTIYPRIVPISRMPTQAKLPFGTIRTNQRLFRDTSQPVGVRKYQPGDSLRHINWKASAHADDLLVKAYQPVMSLDTMILVNLNVEEFSARNRIDGPEWAIILAASLATYLIENRQAVGMASNGFDPLRKNSDLEMEPAFFDKDSGRLSSKSSSNDQHGDTEEKGINTKGIFPLPIQPNPGRSHLMTILETLARIEAGHGEIFSTWLTDAVSFLGWGVTILVISPTGDLKTCRSLHSMVRRGFNPILVNPEPYADFQSIQRRARPFGFLAVHLSSETELRRWLKPPDRVQIFNAMGYSS